VWHFHVAHLGVDGVRKLSRAENVIPTLPEVAGCVCTECVYGKMTRKTFPSVPESSRASRILEIIHSDIAAPIDPVPLGGSQYVLLFTDDFRRYKVGYALKKKSDALKCFKEYKALVEKLHGRPIQKLRTDGGGEYTSNELCHFLHEEGIQAQRTTPYTPQSNGVSERANQTIIGTTRALIHAVSAPKEFWAEGAMPAIYVRNWLPTKSLKSGLTPYEGWFGKPASYVNLWVWGCVAYAQVPQEKQKKLDKTVRKCIFIGYTMTATQYRLYNPDKKVVFTAHDVVFEESKSYDPTDIENGGVPQRYYPPEVLSWEEKVAWGDEFDEEEADADSHRVSRVKKKEKKKIVRVEEPKEEQLVNLAGFDEGENVHMESQPRLKVMVPPAMPGHFGKPPQREKEQWMVKGLRSDRKSSFWNGTPGAWPEATSQLRSKPHRSACVSFANYAMLTTVYMVEDAPRNYRKAMESEEAEEWPKAVDSECVTHKEQSFTVRRCCSNWEESDIYEVDSAAQVGSNRCNGTLQSSIGHSRFPTNRRRGVHPYVRACRESIEYAGSTFHCCCARVRNLSNGCRHSFLGK